ncbi:MAG: N-succinylarginine dihydrolase [Deltaproteobacteria bacterium 13_1_40CM_68_24]|nr:MAG: N-succinylarginine dihydrolase [Deltaproteobacteria bacterium 13_1_40CM_68_24]
MPAREYNFDGLVGPTHNYAGLSHGNVASLAHSGQPASPRGAALQGLAKMRFVASLGVGQAVLPPHERPSLRTLRRLGFRGSDEEVLAQAARDPELKDQLLRISSSAAAMWTANAATCIPSADAADGRLHLIPANLTAMFHRSLEAETTARVLRAIFADGKKFEVHDPLPGGGHFADEGAANHTRLFAADREAVHLLAWGRCAFGDPPPGGEPSVYPARQTREASHALARLGQVDGARALFPQQHPIGIDAGAFHTDVLAVGNGNVLLLHELAFLDVAALLDKLRALLGESFVAFLATERELPVVSAVAAYPFNSQLLTLPDGSMTILAPEEAREDPRARAFLQRVIESDGPVKSAHHLDLRESMENGGGPACLRQRIVLQDGERSAIEARVFWDEPLGAELEAWVSRHYRDRLVGEDLADPRLARENMQALDELTRILRIGSVYDFQK